MPDSQKQLILVSPELRVADPAFNQAVILQVLRDSASVHTVFLFPELCLTGFTCGDLFYQPGLAEAALRALEAIEQTCQELGVWAVIGLPLRHDGALFNAAAICGPQGLVGFSVHPCPNLGPSGRASRQFTAWAGGKSQVFPWKGRNVPLSPDAAFQLPTGLTQVIIGARLTGRLNAEAALVLNPCALPASACPLQASEDPQLLPGQTLARASAGAWESSTDYVYSGHLSIRSSAGVHANDEEIRIDTKSLSVSIADLPAASPLRVQAADTLNQTPFIDPTDPEGQFKQVLEIQSAGLRRRLLHTGIKRLVLGNSGGADSSMALLVCVHTLRQMGLPASGLNSVSMPGPASGAASIDRSDQLARAAGAEIRSIPITRAVLSHLEDIGHDPENYDVTFENAQARERMQILMDLANQENALVVGTGDLSEIALGWSTYNGDHISMYNPNAGLPKTLLLRVLPWAGRHLLGEAGGQVAERVAAATISPELIPAEGADGGIQSTEAVIGPYLLHDFFLYHAIGRSEAPREVFTLATQAFSSSFAPEVILKWLRVFYQRFFRAQFKRSASADGPMVACVSLSPRGGWEMPSDASAALWLAECDEIRSELETQP